MDKQTEVFISQRVAVAPNYTTWNIPRIKCCDKWRNIRNGDLIRKKNAIIGHAFENAILEIKGIMERRGWSTEMITEQKEWCHEQLYYQHYNLRCWKQ